jgi:SAM-dependent methyltransferase
MRRRRSRKAPATTDIRPPAGHDTFFSALDRYFERTLDEHGANARGVDWNGEDSQQLRFAQLLRVVRGDGPFSLNDYGCGYGALAGYLAERHADVDLRGFDVSRRMVEEARRLYPESTFVTEEAGLRPADYTVASGVFNLRLEVADDAWRAYVLDTIASLDALSTAGFAFNMLTKYSDADRMRADLYYGDPGFFFDHCKRHFSRNVALLHDYDLYEFTILVRK